MGITELVIGSWAWWARIGDRGPFETLVKIASKPNEFGGVKVNLIIYQKGAPSSIVVERDSNTKYLRAFVQGDERVWERLAPGPGWQRFYTVVKVVRMEENGLLYCTCNKCPHIFDESTTTGHLILPRYIKNPADLVVESTWCRPALPIAVAVQAPLTLIQKPPDTTERTIAVLKEVVLAIYYRREPEPEDIDLLEGKLGKGPAYVIPAHEIKK
ncbi:MAG: hypothetical protein Q7R84_00845 [bacterium]|nr:hypothetical protein [bacterium]